MSPRRRTAGYVKAVDSAVPVERSIAKIKALVLAYGASGFQVAEDYTAGTVTITFVLNPKGGAHVPVQIPVHIDRVYRAIYAEPPYRSSDGSGWDAPKTRWEQAQRTAWRNVQLLVEAALSSVTLGVQTIEEVFLAHTLVALDGGGTARMTDYLAQTGGALAPGVRALISSGGGS